MLHGKYFCLMTGVGGSKGMLHGKYFCLMTGVGGKQGHAPWKVLLSYDWCWGEARACSMESTFVL